MPAGASPSSNKHQRGDVHTQEHIVRMVRPVTPHYSKRYSFLRCNGEVNTQSAERTAGIAVRKHARRSGTAVLRRCCPVA